MRPVDVANEKRWAAVHMLLKLRVESVPGTTTGLANAPPLSIAFPVVNTLRFAPIGCADCGVDTGTLRRCKSPLRRLRNRRLVQKQGLR